MTGAAGLVMSRMSTSATSWLSAIITYALPVAGGFDPGTYHTKELCTEWTPLMFGEIAGEKRRRHVDGLHTLADVRVRVRRNEADLRRRGRVRDVDDVDARPLRPRPPCTFGVERAQVGEVAERADIRDAAFDVRQLDLANELDVRTRRREVAAGAAVLVVGRGRPVRGVVADGVGRNRRLRDGGPQHETRNGPKQDK